MTNLEQYQQLKKAEIECYKARTKFLKEYIDETEKSLKESDRLIKQSIIIIKILCTCLIVIIVAFIICLLMF